MLDGSNFLKFGWVHGLRLHQYETTSKQRFVYSNGQGKSFIMRGAYNTTHYTIIVKHSQRMSATPLLPWVIIEKDSVLPFTL